MNPTVKRVLVLFSICLNLGFLASAAQHTLFRDTTPKHRRHFVRALEAVEMSGEQRDAMLALEDRLHDNMSGWRKETRHLKVEGFEAMTAEGGPDQARMDAIMDEEARIMRERIGKASAIFVDVLDILGREKTRRFGGALLADLDRR